MAEDLIELGIEGIDKLVDKHFHKVPDKFIDPRTYHLRRRRGDGDEEKSDENEDVLRTDHKDSMRGNKGEKNSATVHRDVAYSPERRESYNPRQRQRTSSPPDRAVSDSRGGYEYVVPPSMGLVPQNHRGRQRREDLVRRSSSQPGALRDNDRESTKEDREKERRKRGRRGKSLHDERRRDIAGARKENRYGGGQNKTEKVVMTLLGAAVGGLAVSAVIDRMDRKSDREDDMRIGGRARAGSGGHGRRDEKRVVKDEAGKSSQ